MCGSSSHILLVLLCVEMNFQFDYKLIVFCVKSLCVLMIIDTAYYLLLLTYLKK